MNLYQFKALKLDEQAQCTWDHGILIGFREEGHLHMVLYRIENFYVEIQYHTSENEITFIKSFVSDEPLQPYLEKIDLQKLLKDL
jgi:hypothetical protein